jgi:NADH dehydrogenase FAD-containing subunit
MTVTLSDEKTMEADLYIPATGLIPNTGFVPKELLTSNGRVDTSAATLRVEKAGPRVYAFGDISSTARPAIHILMEATPVLCANLKRDLLLDAGKTGSEVGADRTFKEDSSETQLVAIGTKKGVGAAMGWQLPSFMVWLIKGRDYWLWTTGNLWSGKQWVKET